MSVQMSIRTMCSTTHRYSTARQNKWPTLSLSQEKPPTAGTGVDPYLVCRYKGTDHVVTIHAQGAKEPPNKSE